MLQVLDHELEEQELKDVLAEAMQTMLAADPDLETDEEGGRSYFGKNKNRSAHLSPEELESAAQWLLERFGQSADGDGDDDEDEEEVRDSTSALASGHVLRAPESAHPLQYLWTAAKGMSTAHIRTTCTW